MEQSPNSQNTKARIFISCGQQKATEEVTIARKIRIKLEKLGFRPYVAVEEQTLRGVKDNIFSRLAESEHDLGLYDSAMNI